MTESESYVHHASHVRNTQRVPGTKEVQYYVILMLVEKVENLSIFLLPHHVPFVVRSEKFNPENYFMYNKQEVKSAPIFYKLNF